MSEYKTGELARLCGVTVRTVQYYDSRGILTPSALSEGGRRIYSEDDLCRLRIICFLRELDLPIDTISQIFSGDQPEAVISELIGGHEKELRRRLGECQDKLGKVAALKAALGRNGFSVGSIGDMALLMKDRKKLRRVRIIMLIAGIPLTVAEWWSIFIWITTGIWWPFLVYTLVMVPAGILISRFYFKNVAYVCPQCHGVFHPALRKALPAKHTPRSRKLTCTNCGHDGFCVEIYGSGKNAAALHESKV